MNKALKKLALADLKRSGLSPTDAAKMRIRPLTASQVGALGSEFPAFKAYQIPYFEMWTGKLNGFFRVRYLEDTRLGINKQTEQKSLKYQQPRNSGNHVYAPPAVKWPAILKDPSKPIIITEGEKKATAACNAGYPTLGLGGVWSFRGQGVRFLPEMDRITWKERKVYVCYDSDVATNADIKRARNALAMELGQRGAKPYLMDLPEVSGQEKTGLDDFLVIKKKDGLKMLLEYGANEFSMMKELHQLNEEVCFIVNPGLVLRLSDAYIMAPDKFSSSIYANLHYTLEESLKSGSTKLVQKKLAPAWIEWENRFQLEKLTYAPGKARIIEGRLFNTWTGWGTTPEKGDIKPWKDLLDYLFQEDAKARRWFEQWLAYPIQTPGYKMYSAALLWGIEHGTGKTLVGHTMMRIYGRNATEIQEHNLYESHNEWAENKQFVMGDEIISREHKRHSADKLKGLTTQKEQRINKKHVPAFSVPDCINYYFTSNHSDAFFLEDKDRRYFIHNVDYPPLPREFYIAYERWMLSDAGAAALHYHLLDLSLFGFDPRGPALQTQSKANMMEVSQSELGTWVRQLKKEPDDMLKMDHVPIQGDLFSADRLAKLYNLEDRHFKATANMMSKELQAASFRQAANKAPIKIKGQVQARYWIVRNYKLWKNAPFSACMKHVLEHDTTVDPKKSNKY